MGLFSKKEPISLWTHNTYEHGFPSANNVTEKGKNYVSNMMNPNPMKNFMFDRYFGIDENSQSHKGLNVFVIGDEKRDIADRIFRHQIEQLKSSFVVSTTSFTLLGMTRSLLAKHGYIIKIINYSDTLELSNLSNSVEQSMSFNFFDNAHTEERVTDLARSMVRLAPNYAKNNAYFNDCIMYLISASIMLLKINKRPTVKDLKTFVASANFKTEQEKLKGKNKFDSSFEEAMLFQNVGSEENKYNAAHAYTMYKAFIRMSGKSRKHIVDGAIEVLNAYDQTPTAPRIKPYNFNEFANKKFAIFIIMDQKNKNYMSQGRLTTQEIVYQFDELHKSNNPIRFMIEGIEAYNNIADYTHITMNIGRHYFTTVLHEMNKDSELEKTQNEILASSADVVIYTGTSMRDDPKRDYIMSMVEKIQSADPDYKKITSKAKRGPNRECVVNKKESVEFKLAESDQLVIVQGRGIFLTTTVY